MNEFDKKILDTFGDLAVDKGIVNRLGLSKHDRNIPSYVMDWIISNRMKTCKNTASLQQSIATFYRNPLARKK